MMHATLQLSDHLQAHLPRGGEFEAIMRMHGQVFRDHKNRRTVRAEIGGRGYFIKTHRPTTWREILKNALRGRWPVLTAKPEWEAIARLEKLGIQTIHAAGFGVRGRFPNRLESFIITDELQGMIHLSELPMRLEGLPFRELSALKRQMINQIARIARQLHRNGLNHRDFYLGHFMIHDRDWSQGPPVDELTLHLIDLHRMQIRGSPTPRRWVIKDISGLMFSALDAGLTSRDYLRFLAAYWGGDEPWRQRWRATRWWRRRVIRRAVSLYRSEHGRSPRFPAALSSFA